MNRRDPLAVPDGPSLVRVLGRWSITALALNSIIGTGVFVLPGTVAGMLGWPSMLAWVLAALFTGVMVLCFAEVSSRFTQAGGAYLYGEAAFGRFIGIQMAWLMYLARCISGAVQANLFTSYLTELWPWVGTRTGGILVTTVFIGLLAALNIRSVGSGARASNVLAVIKVLPLLLFGTLGVVWLLSGKPAPTLIASDPSLGGWLQALLFLMFAYGGFESALIPLGEARNPRRDAPFALLLALALVTGVYLAAQLTVLATVSDPGATNRPLAAAGRVLAGGLGATVITAAALFSVYGWLASNMLNVPRLTLAMAQRGDLPAFFGAIHPSFRTPWVSILLFAGVSWGLAVQAGLLQNLSLSAVSRLLPYAAVCLALPVLRRRDRTGGGPPWVEAALFQAPGGSVLAGAGVLVSLVLASRMQVREAIALSITVALAATHWWVVGRRNQRHPNGPGVS